MSDSGSRSGRSRQASGSPAREPWVFPWPGWIGAFLLFRLFDVRKPWLVGWADRRGDAIGLMLDDVMAGLMAAVVVAVAAGVAHGLLL